MFGTAGSATEAQELRAASGGRVSLAVCDVTNADHVKAWAGGVSDALGTAGLDILINIAGLATPGPIEMLPLDLVRHEFEVSVFGALSVANAFLPALRLARGRIVQVSAWEAGRPLAFTGSAAAAASALETFSDIYRVELQPFGVDVVVVTAANIETSEYAWSVTAAARMASTMSTIQRELYGRTFGAFVDSRNQLQSTGSDLAAAAARLVEIAEEMPARSRAAIASGGVGMSAGARSSDLKMLDPLRPFPRS